MCVHLCNFFSLNKFWVLGLNNEEKKMSIYINIAWICKLASKWIERMSLHFFFIFCISMLVFFPWKSILLYLSKYILHYGSFIILIHRSNPPLIASNIISYKYCCLLEVKRAFSFLHMRHWELMSISAICSQTVCWSQTLVNSKGKTMQQMVWAILIVCALTVLAPVSTYLQWSGFS